MARKSLTPIVLPGNPTAALEAAPKQYVDARVSGGTGGHASFMFSASTTEPPTGSQVRFNNATQSSATKVWIMDTDVDGLDVSVALARIMIGHQLYLQDYDDATKWIKFSVTADAIDKGNYFEVGVVHHSGSAASPLPVQKIELQAIAPGQVGVPPGGTMDQVLAKASATDWDVEWAAPGVTSPWTGEWTLNPTADADPGPGEITTTTGGLSDLAVGDRVRISSVDAMGLAFSRDDFWYQMNHHDYVFFQDKENPGNWAWIKLDVTFLPFTAEFGDFAVAEIEEDGSLTFGSPHPVIGRFSKVIPTGYEDAYYIAQQAARGAGTVWSGIWTFSTDVAGTPAGGGSPCSHCFITDTTELEACTYILFGEEPLSTYDLDYTEVVDAPHTVRFAEFFDYLQAGDRFMVQWKTDANNFIRYELTGAVTHPFSRNSVPVTVIESSGTPTPSDMQDCIVQFDWSKRYVDEQVAVVEDHFPVSHDALTDISPDAHHPRYTDAEAVSATSGVYLPLTGGTLSGPLVLPADPAVDAEAATKLYVDTQVAAVPEGTPHVVDATEPVAPVDGLLWTNPDEDPFASEAAPRGWLAYAEVTANQTGIAGSSTDLTGLSVTLTVDGTRRLRITGHAVMQQQTTAALVTGYIYEDAVVLQRWVRDSINPGERVSKEGSVIHTPSAGSHTYKLALTTNVVTLTMEAGVGFPAFILVEDIGAA